MRFARIVLENWRNFGRVDVALQDRAFLVGPNASGKSNFLDAFRFLRDIVLPGGGFERAVQVRGGVSRIRNLATRRPPKIAIEVFLQEGDAVLWRYRIAFAQDSQRRPILHEESIWQGPDQILRRPISADETDTELLRQTHLEQTSANASFRPVAEFFASVHYYHLVPQIVRDLERSIGLHADPYGGDFLQQIADTPQKTREARLRRIGDALRVAVPQLAQLTLERDERGVTHLQGKYEHWRPAGAWQSEADFSDGTLRLMGLLWSLMDKTGPILLEEPELSLHPDIVRWIPQMMRRVQRGQKPRGRQVLVSTHSSDLLSDRGIAADEVLLFIPSKEGSQIQVGATIAEVKVLLEAGLSVGEAVLPYTRPPNAAQLALWGE